VCIRGEELMVVTRKASLVEEACVLYDYGSFRRSTVEWMKDMLIETRKRDTSARGSSN
jgi:hypothetical protein